MTAQTTNGQNKQQHYNYDNKVLKHTDRSMRNILSKLFRSGTSNKQSQSKKDLVHALVLLPETIRYAMQYKQAQLNHEDVKALLHPSFGWSGVYIMMKFHDKDPSLQLSMLSYVTSHYRDLAGLYKELSLLHSRQQSPHHIKGSKIVTLSRYDFNGLDEKFEKITNKLNLNAQKPILLLYAGLLALPSLLEYYNGDHIRLFNPKQPTQSFRITREGEKRIASQEIVSNISDEYVIVDDIHNTGKSYRNALKSLEDLGHNNKIDIYSAVDTNKIRTQ